VNSQEILPQLIEAQDKFHKLAQAYHKQQAIVGRLRAQLEKAQREETPVTVVGEKSVRRKPVMSSWDWLFRQIKDQDLAVQNGALSAFGIDRTVFEAWKEEK